MKLFQYQNDGADWLAARENAFLADDMGVGKTAQLIHGADLVCAETVLVACPAFLQYNWISEFQQWSMYDRKYHIISGQYGEPLKGHVNLVSYNQAERARPEKLTKTGGAWYDLVIADEGHYLKTIGTARTKAIYGDKFFAKTGVIGATDRTWVASATPTPNNPTELYPHFRALFPDILKTNKMGPPIGFDTFAETYCVFGQKKGRKGDRPIVGAKNLDVLKSRMAPHFLRRTLEEVAPQVPDIFWGQLHLYNPAAMDAEDGMDDSEKLMLLRALEDGEIKKHEHTLATLRHFYGVAKAQTIAPMIKSELENNPDMKLVVFAYHKEVIEILRTAFAPKNTIVIEGSVPMAKRHELTNRFQTDPAARLLIGQYIACGEGLTLTAAHHALFVEYDWSPEKNRQSAARLRRIGQTKKVLARMVSLVGSLDEQITNICFRKANMISALFD